MKKIVALTAALLLAAPTALASFQPPGVNQGGTGTTTFTQGWLYSSGGTTTLAASTSPTVNFITATSSAATSTFRQLQAASSTTLGPVLISNPGGSSSLTISNPVMTGLTNLDTGNLALKNEILFKPQDLTYGYGIISWYVDDYTRKDAILQCHRAEFNDPTDLHRHCSFYTSNGNRSSTIKRWNIPYGQDIANWTIENSTLEIQGFGATTSPILNVLNTYGTASSSQNLLSLTNGGTNKFGSFDPVIAVQQYATNTAISVANLNPGGQQAANLDSTGKFGFKHTVNASGGYGLNIVTNGSVSTSNSVGLALFQNATSFDVNPTLTVDSRTAGKPFVVRNNATEYFSVGTSSSPGGTGAVGIGSSTPYARLAVAGDSIVAATSTASVFVSTSTTATSTFANGINLTGGCLAVNGACFSGGGAGTPGGADTQVQFNDGGSFGGDSVFTFNKATKALTVSKLTVTGTTNVALGVGSGSTDGSLSVTAGASNVSGNGSALTLTGGAQTGNAGNNGGPVWIVEGTGDTGGGGSNGHIRFSAPGKSSYAELNLGSLTTSRILTLRDSAGTVALTSDFTGAGSMLAGYVDATTLAATSTPTAAAYLATSTTATSTFPGFVTVGTTTLAGYQLAVANGGNVSGQIGLQAGTFTADIGYGNSLSSFIVGSRSNNALALKTNNVNRLVITNSGLAGFATATPFTNFSVVGSAYFTGTTTAPVLLAASTTGTSQLSGAVQVLGSTTLQNFTALNSTTTSIFSSVASSSLMFSGGASFGTMTAASVVGIGSTSPSLGALVVDKGGIVTPEYNWGAGTSTTMTVDFASTTPGKSAIQQLIGLGTSAVTINMANAIPGSSIRLILCNPSSGTVGTVTWGSGIYFPAGVAPGQTTSANKCDLWDFIATVGTSTSNAAATSTSIWFTGMTSGY